MPQTPRQTFRIEEYLWRKFKEKCKRKGYSASEVLRAFIRQFVAGKIKIEDLKVQRSKRGEKLGDFWTAFEEWLKNQNNKDNRNFNS